MTFRETLARHLKATQDRDLTTLADTVAEDATGSNHGRRQARAHQAAIFEGSDLAVAVLRLTIASRRP
jgi:hypothetical protein